MKAMTRMLSLILGTLFLAGCASSPCKCKTTTSEPVAIAAVPVAPVVAQKSAPVAAEVPVAVKRYVSK